MNELKTAETDLKTAQRTLAELHAELPNFEKLVSDNERAADLLKAERASLDDQVGARTRVTVAREMLEQHHSDIATAQAEVEKLEGNAEREGHLDAMTGHAKDAERLHGEFLQTLDDAHADLAKHAEVLATLWVGLLGSRNSFVNAGRPLAQMFAVTAVPYGWTPERAAAERELAEAILEEVEARGADVSYSLTRYDGRHISACDLTISERDLRYPQPFGGALGAALETQLRRTE